MAPVIRDIKTNEEDKQASKVYRRTHATAEEKIQEELRDMKKREEELRWALELFVFSFGKKI